MSQIGSQAAAFFHEVAQHQIVWYVRDDQGSPVPQTAGGEQAMPYWSSRAGAQHAADIWGSGLRPASVPLDRWRDAELAELDDEGLRVGVNWTGPRLAGRDFTVAEVRGHLDQALGEGGPAAGS